MKSIVGRLLGVSFLAALICTPIFAAGAVKSEEKPDLLGGIAGPIISKDGKPVKAMVMPVSITIPDDVAKQASMDDEKEAELRQNTWEKLGTLVDKSDKFIKASAPDGAEADDVIKKTIAHAAGMLPAEEFKKITKFKLPERFIYGHISLTLQEDEELRGFKVIKHIKYFADAQIRLVNSANFTYQPSLATASDTDLSKAIEKAMTNALDKYRLSADEKPKKTEDSGGFFN
ncbi:MAG: hypothetical protein JXR97_00820 [Planctomycetes bacterium]|nr:hypothetical protein [Planctomycetota bacterium]